MQSNAKTRVEGKARRYEFFYSLQNFQIKTEEGGKEKGGRQMMMTIMRMIIKTSMVEICTVQVYDLD